MIRNEIKEAIIRIIQKELIWYRHYIGKVLNVNDPKKKGRILVGILDLGCFTADVGFWCWPRDKKSLITPNVNDWVEVYFINGDRDMPAYLGIAHEMINMVPKNYDGKNTTQIIFESNNKKFFIKYDENKNKIQIEHEKFHMNYDANKDELEIGSKDFMESARKEDETLSNSSTDSNFWTWISGFLNVFKSWTPVPNDGGGALKTSLSSFFGSNPDPTELIGKINEGSTQIKIGDK